MRKIALIATDSGDYYPKNKGLDKASFHVLHGYVGLDAVQINTGIDAQKANT